MENGYREFLRAEVAAMVLFDHQTGTMWGVQDTKAGYQPAQKGG